MEALLDILDNSHVPVLVNELIALSEDKIVYELAAYAKAFGEGLLLMKLPRLHYGALGAYGYFELKLLQLAKYGVLRSKVFQAFRGE